MNFGTKGCEYNCGDECDGRCLPFNNISKFKTVCLELSKRLGNIPYDSADMSDIGNEIGIIIAKYFDDKDFGWDEDGFISGLNHGISLTDGTHFQ